MKKGKKLVSYILSGVGLLLILASFESVKGIAVKFLPFIKDFPDWYFLVSGGILIVLAVFSLKTKVVKEVVKRDVPVVEGGQVVAYKRE